MATVRILKETENSVTFLIIGNSVITNFLIVDASTLAGAKIGTSFHHLEVVDAMWSVSGSNVLTLSWAGTPVLPFLHLSSGSGWLRMNRYLNTKITNTAASANGDILLTTATNDRYSLFLICDKTREGFNKVGSYVPPAY